MILLNVTIRCDHPGCGAETQGLCEPMSMPREGIFPWMPPKAPPGWSVPKSGDRYDAPVACPEHSKLPVAPT